VTGLHDIDEYIQAQLLLAVSLLRYIICFLMKQSFCQKRVQKEQWMTSINGSDFVLKPNR